MQSDPTPQAPAPDIHRGRLQRAPDADGYRVATFADVMRRHGFTMALLATLCLLVPGAWGLLEATTARAVGQPLPYLAGLAAMLLFFAWWSVRRRGRGIRQVQWIAYLLMISVVEEITFRLVFPTLLANALPLPAAHIISNLAFAVIHYFTLRWRLGNCVGTFLGGMGLSHVMEQGDLVLVILVHWIGTFLNTPLPPSESSAGPARQSPGE